MSKFVRRDERPFDIEQAVDNQRLMTCRIEHTIDSRRAQPGIRQTRGLNPRRGIPMGTVDDIHDKSNAAGGLCPNSIPVIGACLLLPVEAIDFFRGSLRQLVNRLRSCQRGIEGQLCGERLPVVVQSPGPEENQVCPRNGIQQE